MRRLVMVSNRVAPLRGGPSAGGLSVALMQSMHGRNLWFGWSGKTVEAASGEVRMQHGRGVTLALIDLARADYEGYYNGFANGCLWPLFHFRADLMLYDAAQFKAYRRVNRQFAEALVKLLKPDDLIWVHDYHLFPLATELRSLGVKTRIGYFQHTPFAPADLIDTLPAASWLMQSLFDYDLVGFQTEADLQRFHDCVRRAAQGSVDADGRCRAFGRELEAGVFPVGIDVDKVEQAALAVTRDEELWRLRDTLKGRDQLVGVDRLDYSKGLLRRLHAFQLLLERAPAVHGKVELLQIAPVSRGELPAYRDFRVELERAAARINGRFARLDWTPVRYLSRPVPWATLARLYRISRVGLVTPMRDGMNLVAKEYVAAQDPDEPGVLVLSRYAGAARQMAAALLVNPYDSGDVASALQRALSMPVEERRERYQDLLRGLKAYDLHHWREAFVGRLAGDATPLAQEGKPEPAVQPAVQPAPAAIAGAPLALAAA